MTTTIDREAWLPAAVASLPGVAALVARRPRLAAALLMLPVGIVAFFRDPEREVDRREAAADDVLAPADGKVMHAGPAQEAAGPAGDWQQVSIFLSLFDVHVNRAPYGGTVESVVHRPGRWLAAYKFESAFENERSDIVVTRTVAGREHRYVFRQVVGLVARRVVTRIRPGAEIRTGQRIGLMKFGSRMDVFLPLDAHLAVQPGDRVVGGETVIARWTSRPLDPDR